MEVWKLHLAIFLCNSIIIMSLSFAKLVQCVMTISPISNHLNEYLSTASWFREHLSTTSWFWGYGYVNFQLFLKNIYWWLAHVPHKIYKNKLLHFLYIVIRNCIKIVYWNTSSYLSVQSTADVPCVQNFEIMHKIYYVKHLIQFYRVTVSNGIASKPRI